MPLFPNLLRSLRSLFRTRSVEREIDEELRGFIEESAAARQRAGMSRSEALRAARIEMGSANAVTHRIRSAGWESFVEILWHDVRYCLRTLARTPGFTFVALLSLALGIGANTAIFTLVRQVLLRELPVHDPQQLVTFGPSLGHGILGGVDLGLGDEFTYDFARRLQADPGPFAGVASYSSINPEVSVRVPNAASALQIHSSMVTGNYFSVLGANPLLGRTIIPADAATPDQNAVVVISYHFWQQSLSADPAIIGKTITLNATPFTVIGVMPPAFQGIRRELQSPDLWVPLTMVQEIFLQPGMLEPRSLYFLHMFARRAPGTSLASDQQWLNRQVQSYVRAGEGATITPARQQEINRLTVLLVPGSRGVSQLGDQYGPSLKILMAVVALVLLIACANLANFLLARAISRQREIATRLALGSSRARIVRQSLLESLLLSIAGGIAGLGLAFAATRGLIAFVAQGAVYTSLSPRPDSYVLLFTLAVSITAAVLFGLAPAIRVARIAAGSALNRNARTASSTGSQTRAVLPRVLVVGQVVLSLLLLVGAGLFLRTLLNLQNQDYGFERTHLVVADFDPHLAGYRPEQVPTLNQQLIERFLAIPGVQAAALSDTPPISFGQWRSSLTLTGYTPAPKEDMGSVLNRVSGLYFQTAGIPMVAGRSIAAQDTTTTQKVCVINQTLARHFYPGGDAVGHTLKIDIDTVEGPWLIVGIARDTKSGNPREPSDRMVYIPLAQITGKHGEGIQDSFAYTILLRTQGDPAAAIGALRKAVADVDPNLPLLKVRTMQEHLEAFVSHEALISRLTVLFALLALLLACIGLYGVMSYSVTRRSSEIGIRIALGAGASTVEWMVLRESLFLLLAGVILGLPLALEGGALVRAQLYELSPFDPVILACAVGSIALVTLLAAWLPARRAAAVDPMTALRCE